MVKRLLLYAALGLLMVQNVNAQLSNCSTINGTLRIMSYNIRNAKGMDLKTDYRRIANVINGLTPDVVAVQEADSATNRSKGVDVLAELASLTGMYGTFGAATDYDGGKYGVGILSKEQPLRCYNIPLPGREEARTVLIAELNEYVFACTHWSLTQEDRMASVAIVNEQAKLYNKPMFLAGDFNMVPESAEFLRLAESWEVLNSTKKNTFPSDNPERCIDFIFVRSTVKPAIKLLQDSVLNEPIASDHRPLFVDIKPLWIKTMP